MRQVLLSRSGAVVARMPRPLAGPGQVLVRVQYSLVSVGTEIAPLRSIASDLQSNPMEQATAYASLARRYLGKAIRDPKKALRRAAGIVRREARRRLKPERKKVEPTVSLGEIGWERATQQELNVRDQQLRLVTDDSDFGYQILSQPIAVPKGCCVVVELRGELEEGAVAFGLLDSTRTHWLGQHPFPPGPIDDRIVFAPGESEEVTLVITNHGAGSSTLTLDTVQVQLPPENDAGIAQNELGDTGWCVGYSAAGTVVEVGEGVTDLQPGDPVACGGAAYAHHADFIAVPRNLVCRVPRDCSLETAATATVGSIAMQGVRRARPELGETVCVLGLGLIGQITSQLLRANGCRVIGMDLDPERVERALALGMDAGCSDPDQLGALIRDHTGGHGADRTLITAATRSHKVINQAMEVTRRRGAVVIVGDVGLAVERNEFYRKEIDLLMSTSYGPGRYDACYEEDGNDYPFAYVRWTLNRNMSSYLALIAQQRIDIGSLIDQVVPIDEAPEAYQELARGGKDLPLGVLFRYPEEVGLEESPQAPRIRIRGHRKTPQGPARYALVGAGAFGTAMLVPQMDKCRDAFFLRGVVSRDGAKGGNFARERRLEVAASDLESVLSDPEFDLLVIATRHREHAEQVNACLQAGKHVFVEKPLATTWEQLESVEQTVRELTDPPLLMVGFNRRFSPALAQLREVVANRRTPLVIQYRLNGGYIPPESWIQTEVGAGRNIGEACHMYDVFRSLAGAPVRSIQASSINPRELPYFRNDNFAATLTYEDGTLANLVYTALGPKQGLPKERIEVFCDGETYLVDDFKKLIRCSDGAVLWQSSEADKGHYEELRQFGTAIQSGSEAPIPLDEIIETTAVSLRVEDLLLGRETAEHDS